MFLLDQGFLRAGKAVQEINSASEVTLYPFLLKSPINNRDQLFQFLESESKLKLEKDNTSIFSLEKYSKTVLFTDSG